MNIEHNIKTGMSHATQFTVDTNHTAGALYGFGVLDVLLSTPALIAIMLETSIELLDSLIPVDHITVVTSCEVTHEHPTMFGEDVTIKVIVKELDGNRIFLDMIATDGSGDIGYGKIERAIINKTKLMERACLRSDIK